MVVPFLRPLRLLRIIIFGSRAWIGIRRLVHVDFLVVYGIGLVIVSATLAVTAERGTDSMIQSFPEALWWSMATITTVGYGDMVPITVMGRAVGIVLMLGGIAFYSGLTANLASILVKGADPREKSIARLTEQVEKLRDEIASLQNAHRDNVKNG